MDEERQTCRYLTGFVLGGQESDNFIEVFLSKELEQIGQQGAVLVKRAKCRVIDGERQRYNEEQ